MKLVESKQYTITAVTVAIILLIIYGLSVGVVVQEEKHRNHSKKLRLNRHTDLHTLLPLTNYYKSPDRKQSLKSIEPSFKCPSRLLTRVGQSLGGGKWICGLHTLESIRWYPNNSTAEPCLIYSFGVEEDSSFEAEILANTHCSVYAYDHTVPSIGKPLHESNPRVIFEQFGIGGEDAGDKLTLATIMKLNAHEGRNIAILKIDVTGWEFSCLENILKDFPYKLPFSQLLIKLYFTDSEENSDKAENIINVFQELENRGFRLFSTDHDNLEFSFVNLNRLDLFLEEQDIVELVKVN